MTKANIAALRKKHLPAIQAAATATGSGKTPDTITAEYDGTAGDLLALVLELGEVVDGLAEKVRTAPPAVVVTAPPASTPPASTPVTE